MFLFFQAEGGIRDRNVTGVQTCALPISLSNVDATVGGEVPLVFDTHGEKPDPYLGALGHVVIVDEDVEHYIHVHPDTDDTTTFNAHFSKPGLYKIWGEFKFGDQVHVYSFVVEVKA